LSGLSICTTLCDNESSLKQTNSPFPRNWCDTFSKHDRQGAYNVTVRRIRETLCCSGKAISTTYPECVFVAIGIQYAIGMRRIAICGLSGSKYLSTLFHIRHNFLNKNVEHKTCGLIFSANFVSNIPHSKKK